MSENRTRPPDQTAAPSAPGGAGYRVLARRYRPSTFADLIGQDAMVRTVSNAFETGRIPQAWILTGVRGVGKTTTARILARALNYQLADGSIQGPTIDMPVLGEHCQAIIESRHIDVHEMDAASHNGVDDVRQINDAVRYAPVSARYKVYILDEVHMLSTAAFNALLKTLEEPPPHAKFIFATTEIRKVPVTVLSRCQRFDLRRVDADLLVRHLSGIAEKENVRAEAEALALIARAAEGSVRDSLSLLDQAIAHAAGEIRAEDVRQMLGLSDRARVVDLFEMLLKGDIAGALKELRDQYDSGADPVIVLSDLAEFTHFVTRVKLVPSVADDLSLSEAERVRGKAFAAQLSMRILSRTWQMLLKGLSEVQQAPRPVAAAEMLLVRIAYAADLPTPDEAIRALANGNRIDQAAISAPRGNGGSPAAGFASPSASAAVAVPRTEASRSEAPRGAPRAVAASALNAAPRPVEAASSAPPPLSIGSFEDLVQLAADQRDLRVKTALERDVRLVRCEDGKLEFALEPGASQSIVNELPAKLKAWTGRPWAVALSREPGLPTLKAQMDAREAELKRGVRGDPLVQAVLERFPGAEIVAVRPREPEQPAHDTHIPPDPDMMPDDDDSEA
ncbi:DNA polymerase III subunit gamma/tau [Pseudorhodoplanes sp.]|uniref:DNA polymerase III subunit gamma/tau n=1 Tax=Pseudorhodoplanes sp. TaxID=1934341 RepID=UPI00391AEA5C